MKRPAYRDAVAFIALEDDPAAGPNADEIVDYITTALVADMFGVDVDRVARDVAKVRRKQGVGLDKADSEE